MRTGRPFLMPAVLALGSVLGPAAPVRADPGPASPSVEWRAGRLSVAADGVPLTTILEAVAVATGAEVWGLSTLEGSASVRFDDLTLRDGLRALLAHVEYALVEEPAVPPGIGGRVVVVVDGPGRGSAAPSVAERAGAVEPAVASPPEQGDLQALRDAAEDGDVAARALAMQRLARQDPSEARAAATEAARSEDPRERVVAVQVLGGLDSLEATNVLGAALMDPDPSVRHAALVGLMGQKSPAATQYVMQAMHDDSESIRLLALELLAQRGAEGKPAVNRALADRDPAVRARARELLERSGAAR